MEILTAAETPTLGRTSTFPSIRGYPCCVSIPSRSKSGLQGQKNIRLRQSYVGVHRNRGTGSGT